MSKEILYAFKATEKDINSERQFLMNCFFVSIEKGIMWPSMAGRAGNLQRWSVMSVGGGHFSY